MSRSMESACQRLRQVELLLDTSWGVGAEPRRHSGFREQRGVFLARGISVGITDNGCAWEEPEGLACRVAVRVFEDKHAA